MRFVYNHLYFISTGLVSSIFSLLLFHIEHRIGFLYIESDTYT
jgi:hypothetical protein